MNRKKSFILFILIFFYCFSAQALQISSALNPDKNIKNSENHLWEYSKTHFNYYSTADEIRIGERFMQEQVNAFNKQKLSVNPLSEKNNLKRFQEVVKRLAKVSDNLNLPYEVTIFDKKDVVNAYCLPGGKIGVFTGLYDRKNGLIDLKTDDEIAAVLAHEMAHANLRHVTRRMTTYNSVGLLGNLVSFGVAKGAGQSWGYLTNQVFNTGTFLYFPSYSRKQEREADQVGFYYLVKAGFDPQAAIRVWDRAAKDNKNKKRDKTSFFDSHPADGERADFLRSFSDDVVEVQKQLKMQKAIKE